MSKTILDVAQTPRAIKKSSLITVTCVNCEKVFWSNVETRSCVNGAHKLGTQSNSEKNR